MKQRFSIEGMSCMHCVNAVKQALEEIGITSHEVEKGSAIVNYDPEVLTEAKISESITEAGYTVTGVETLG